jgi:AAA domain
MTSAVDRFDDIDRAVRSAYEKFAKGARDGEAKPDGSSEEWQWRYFGRQQDIVERLYLVDKLLPETGVGLISGQWGTYKTFVAVDLAAAVITGTPFAGFEIARQGAVLFIALEGQGEVDIRIRAALTHRGHMEALAPFAWIDTSPRLLDTDSGKALTVMVKQAAEKMMQDFNFPVALVIVDTAGKAAGYAKAGDENDAVVGRQIVAALAEASRETCALFLGVDHFGKAAETGTRGSSAKESDCDAVLALLGDKSISGEVTNPRLAIRKRRSGPNGVEIPLRPKVVTIDDFTGETTLVVDWLQPDQVAPATKPDVWAKSLRLLRHTLMNVLVDHGIDRRPFPDGPTVRAVNIDIVRTEFYKSYPADGDAKAKQEARKKALQRAVKDAQERSLIGVREIEGVTYVWLATPEPQGGP